GRSGDHPRNGISAHRHAAGRTRRRGGFHFPRLAGRDRAAQRRMAGRSHAARGGAGGASRRSARSRSRGTHRARNAGRGLPRLRAVARAPAAVDVGQVFEVTVDLINDGDADALGAQLAAPVTAGASLVGTAAAPQDVPAGATRTFRWSMQAGSAGELDLSTSGTASDPLAGSTLPLAAGWDPVSVQSAPALSVAISAPPVASTGQRIAVRVDVTNAGDATAAGVVPSLSSTGSFAVGAAPTAADVAGHTTS